MSNPFIAALFMAAAAYIPRVFPIAVFRREIRSPFFRSFLKYVPYSVLSALTFPDIFYSTGSIPESVLATAAALLLALWGKSLVTVAIGAILTAFFAGLIL